MKKAIVLILITVLAKGLFANIGLFDAYISYSNELRFRAGLNYKNLGIYLRPVFSDDGGQNYLGTNVWETYSFKRRGAEFGLNLNKTLFTYKKTEVIVNFFSGFVLTQISQSGKNNYWEKSADLGIIPEIRFFKKASITFAPYYYRYFFANQETNKTGWGTLSFINTSMLQMSIGFKFYY